MLRISLYNHNHNYDMFSKATYNLAKKFIGKCKINRPISPIELVYSLSSIREICDDKCNQLFGQKIPMRELSTIMSDFNNDKLLVKNHYLINDKCNVNEKILKNNKNTTIEFNNFLDKQIVVKYIKTSSDKYTHLILNNIYDNTLLTIVNNTHFKMNWDFNLVRLGNNPLEFIFKDNLCYEDKNVLIYEIKMCNEYTLSIMRIKNDIGNIDETNRCKYIDRLLNRTPIEKNNLQCNEPNIQNEQYPNLFIDDTNIDFYRTKIQYNGYFTISKTGIELCSTSIISSCSDINHNDRLSKLEEPRIEQTFTPVNENIQTNPIDFYYAIKQKQYCLSAIHNISIIDTMYPLYVLYRKYMIYKSYIFNIN